jgi:hypothetical protein
VVLMDGSDERPDKFLDVSDIHFGDSGDEQTLRRDNLVYLLSEIELALDRALSELSHDDATTIGARFNRLGAKVLARFASCSD